MYSYTATGVNNIHSVDPNAPKLRIRCKCNRDLIQQEIYTCISCTNYCCHFCTIPDIVNFQCRNCKTMTEQSRNNKCKMCFSCPYCSNVLVVSRSANKKFIMLCNFCGWNTQEIDIETDKGDELIEAVNKFSASMRENQYKIYTTSQGFFKETTNLIEHQNQVCKYLQNPKKTHKKNQDDSLYETKNQLQKNCDSLIKRTGLDDTSEEVYSEIKVPQNLPLLAKKSRRCPNCKKPLTTTFQTRTGEQKLELMYKDLKVLQCQRLPAQESKVKVKCLRNITLNGEEECLANDIKQIQINKVFKVQIKIVNRTREVVSHIEYDFIVL